jgi:hypothetical protein
MLFHFARVVANCPETDIGCGIINDQLRQLISVFLSNNAKHFCVIVETSSVYKSENYQALHS